MQADFSRDIQLSQGAPALESPPAKRSSCGCWLLATVLVVLALSLLVCCGGGYFVTRFGMSMLTSEIEDQLRDNPLLRDKIGDVQSFEMDWVRSFRDQQDDTFVYRVKGTKGEGEVTVRHVTNDEGDEEILSATLRLPNGERVELVPAAKDDER
jgi:hypothetical protein